MTEEDYGVKLYITDSIHWLLIIFYLKGFCVYLYKESCLGGYKLNPLSSLLTGIITKGCKGSKKNKQKKKTFTFPLG